MYTAASKPPLHHSETRDMMTPVSSGLNTRQEGAKRKYLLEHVRKSIGLTAQTKAGEDMQIGMVGLGRMGGNITVRLLRGGHEVIGHSRSSGDVQRAVAEGAGGASSLEDLVA